MFDTLQHFFAATIPALPPQTWWIAVLALLVLGTAAVVDMFEGIIPDPLIFFGMIGIVAAKGIYIDWPYAAHQMTFGLIAAVIIWGINELWRMAFKHDALGLGDAKWTMLAVTCFGILPALFAWGLGSILGTIWILAQKIARRRPLYVHFAPFLYIGLVVGLILAPITNGRVLN